MKFRNLNINTIKNILRSTFGTFITTSFGVYVLYLFYIGKINFYIHPRYTEFAVITSWIAIAFGVMFIIRAIETRGKSLVESPENDHHAHSHAHNHEHHDHEHNHVGHEHKHEHDHNHDHKHDHDQIKSLPEQFKDFIKQVQLVLGILLIVLPVFLGFLLPATRLSSVTALQRVVDLNSVRETESVVSLFLKNTRNYTLGDWIKVINNNPDLSLFVDKEVSVSGFVFSPDGSSDKFLISRFLITCCAVDARPLGLWVESNWRGAFRENQWVELNGRLKLAEINGAQTLVVEPETINPIPEPLDPYVF